MPELPEAERARQQIERALGREIVAVDDRDTYVCRPHAPGEIAAALVGRRLTAAHRRGKFLWAETDGGPELGLHLGMAGRIVRRRAAGADRWDRFALEFADGGRLALRDKRRLGRARDRARLLPRRPGRRRGRPRRVPRAGRPRHAAVKARLLDQGAIAGRREPARRRDRCGARGSRPRRPAGELSDEELDRLRRELRAATRAAIRKGGVHTGEFIPHRERGGTCPRCGTTLERATIGGRTTFWCPTCQPSLGRRVALRRDGARGPPRRCVVAHPGPGEQVGGGRADLADDHADRQVAACPRAPCVAGRGGAQRRLAHGLEVARRCSSAPPQRAHGRRRGPAARRRPRAGRSRPARSARIAPRASTRTLRTARSICAAASA